MSAPAMPMVIGLDFGSSYIRTAVAGPDLRQIENRHDTRRLLPEAEITGNPLGITFRALKNRVGMGFEAERHKEAAVRLLSEAWSDVRHEIGDTPVGTVMTVPACFSERQRAALSQVGSEAGFPNVRLIDESLAVTIGLKLPPQTGNVLVYSLGAGVFCASVIRTAPGLREALWHEGDRDLGGNDFDARTAELLLSRARLTASHFALAPEGAARLRAVAEQVRNGLSRREAEVFELHERDVLGDPGGGDTLASLQLTRAELEEVLGPLVEETIRLSIRAVETARLGGQPLQSIVLTGGATRTPLVERRLRETFNLPLLRAGDFAIASGAALYGSQLGHQVWGPAERSPAQARVAAAGAEPAVKEQQPAPAVHHAGAAALDATGASWPAMFMPYLIEAQQQWGSGQRDAALVQLEDLIRHARVLVSNLKGSLAEGHLSEERFDDAARLFEEMLIDSPKDRKARAGCHQAYKQKAIMHWQRGEVEPAAHAIHHALRIVPDCPNCKELSFRINTARKARAGRHRK